MFTVLVGILFLCFAPKSPYNPVSNLGLRYFNDREIQILSKRVLLDDPSKVHTHVNISREEFKSVVSQAVTLQHNLFTNPCS